MTDWPTHPDGRNKKIGEMSREECRAVTADAVAKVKRELEDPAMQEKMAAVLRGENIQQ